MIRLREITILPEQGMDRIRYEAARLLKLPAGKIREITIVRRSVDARKKPDVRISYTVDVRVDGNEKKILARSGCRRAEIAPVYSYRIPKLPRGKVRPIVVGFGPAGMFAALVLALAGQCPLVLERGDDVATRKQKVEAFQSGGELDPRSNIQFGEGGAGTFSDGKLNTGVNNPRIHWILQQFVEAGAAEEILFDAKPHVGTDVLVQVVEAIRHKIEGLGGEVRFRTQVTDFRQESGVLTAVRTDFGEEIPARQVILAIGHSARDTFRMLEAQGIPMEPKPFAMGVRIEHLQRNINLAQYGGENPCLPPADYKLVEHLEDGTVYTFCMCPGGYVVAAASESGGVVTNGMSNSDRGGENANAALLVTVKPEEFPYSGALGGMQWQREIEERAFACTGSYRAPAQTLGDFLAGEKSEGQGAVCPTYRPGVYWCDLHQVLPEKITCSLEKAIPGLDRKLRGFADPSAVLTAPETRSSSPVRILRGDNRQSAVAGLYPTGEGAGYAGGIMSAAIDGMLSAEAILQTLQEES